MTEFSDLVIGDLVIAGRANLREITKSEIAKSLNVR
jgi:hypothetical protein